MTSLEIIVSTSFFTAQTVVGVAFPGDSTPCNVTKWADGLPHGRPATVQPLNGRPEAEQITYLIGRWLAWSELYSIPLTINPTPRKVAGPF